MFKSNPESIAFYLEDEVGRTREDAQRNAFEAHSILAPVRDAANRKIGKMSALGRGHDRQWQYDIPNFGRIKLSHPDEDLITFMVVSDEHSTLTCDISGTWEKPTHDHIAWLANIFLHAATAIATPEKGDLAREQLLKTAAHAISQGADDVAITGHLPWRSGKILTNPPSPLDLSLTLQEQSYLAGVACSFTYRGIILAISPHSLALNANDLDPMEILRLLSSDSKANDR